MNPEKPILARRSGTSIQIFNLELKSKLKCFNMLEPVVFWKWTSPSNLALVTAVSVYHWLISGDAPPTKVFDRHSNMPPNVQIINYQVSPDEKWFLLGGICAGATPGIVNGAMQLFSKEKNASMPLRGHAGAFHKISILGHEEAQVLCFHQSTNLPGDFLYIMEVGRDPTAGPSYRVGPTLIPDLRTVNTL